MHRDVGSDGWGKAQWLGVQEGKLTIFVGGGWWWDRLHFSTGRSNSNYLQSRNRRQHDNQTSDDGVWAETAGGWCGGFGFSKGLFVEFSAGGGLSTAILSPGGRKQSRRLVPNNNNTTIKQWTKGSGLKWGVCMGGRLDLPVWCTRGWGKNS